MTATTPIAVRADVWAAIASVDDPEYPGISIVDLGLSESVIIHGSMVTIGLSLRSRAARRYR